MVRQVQAFLEDIFRNSDEVGSCELSSWGRSRRFVVREIGADTFIFEDGIWEHAANKDPLIVMNKRSVGGGAGHIMTCSHGNHAVTLVPLLSNKFPGLPVVDERARSDIMQHKVVCANIVKNTIELSQRDAETGELVDSDTWLRSLGLGLDGVVLADRVDTTLEYYRQLGQEWRVKPLAWTPGEMLHALKDSRAKIHAGCSYFHSVKGVHLLTFSEFCSVARLINENFDAFKGVLLEWVGVSEREMPLMLHEKYHGHHEIEPFGLPVGIAEEMLVPRLINLGKLAAAGEARGRIENEFDDLCSLFRRCLIDPELEDESSQMFLACMYKHLTGVIYQGGERGVAMSFDDRKTALPGGTYLEGERAMHPGVDARTVALLDYVEARLSHNEDIVSANIYEIRSQDSGRLGQGRTREIVYGTNMHPIPLRQVEKRLAHASSGYGEYTLTRVQAFRNLGISFGSHHLLERLDRKTGAVHYYVRQRYPGEPTNAIPKRYFQSATGEDATAVLRVAALLGEAAAENAILKKYVPESETNSFGVGKEIIEFEYDVIAGRELPVRVWLCSIRGTLGWPNEERTQENLRAFAEYYASAFAGVVVDFWHKHADCVGLREVEKAFVGGFASKTREAFWNYNTQRELFDSFSPPLQSRYEFDRKWAFAIWALVQQHRRLREFRGMLARRIRREAAHG